MYFVLQRYALKSDCMLQKHYYLHREWIKMCGNTSCDALLCVVAQVTFCSCPTACRYLADCTRILARVQVCIRASTGGGIGSKGRNARQSS